jgi:hypothetical protein
MPVPRHPSPGPTQQPHANGDQNAQMNVSPPPPFLNPHLQQTGYPFVRPPSGSASPALPGGVRASTDETPLAHLGPVERSQNLNLRKRAMQPYLQFMCGPLLRYDTIDEYGVWHGAALIVSKCWLNFSLALVVILAGAKTSLPYCDMGNVIRSLGRWVYV